MGGGGHCSRRRAPNYPCAPLSPAAAQRRTAGRERRRELLMMTRSPRAGATQEDAAGVGAGVRRGRGHPHCGAPGHPGARPQHGWDFPGHFSVTQQIVEVYLSVHFPPPPHFSSSFCCFSSLPLIRSGQQEGKGTDCGLEADGGWRNPSLSLEGNHKEYQKFTAIPFTNSNRIMSSNNSKGQVVASCLHLSYK